MIEIKRPKTCNGSWRCEMHPDLTPGERFPSDGGGPFCLACGQDRPEPAPAGKEASPS